METRKDRMAHPYTPKLHDYVKWHRPYGGIDEGWVYFVDEEYITIEVNTKDKPHCEYTKEEKHKKIHVLVVCPPWCWHQLEYITSRTDYNDESHRHRVKDDI